CDGAMIGRGAIENPWIFKQTKHYLETGEHLPEITVDERIELCIRHLRDNVAYRGERRGVMSFRRYYANYLKGLRDATRLRVSLMDYTELAPIEARLRAYQQQLADYATSVVA